MRELTPENLALFRADAEEKRLAREDEVRRHTEIIAKAREAQELLKQHRGHPDIRPEKLEQAIAGWEATILISEEVLRPNGNENDPPSRALQASCMRSAWGTWHGRHTRRGPPVREELALVGPHRGQSRTIDADPHQRCRGDRVPRDGTGSRLPNGGAVLKLDAEDAKYIQRLLKDDELEAES